MMRVLLDSWADISIMNDTLASELVDSSENQVTMATNDIIKLTGKGTATVVVGEDTRISTTLFTSRDVIQDLLFISREVMAEIGLLGKLKMKKKSKNIGDKGQGTNRA